MPPLEAFSLGVPVVVFDLPYIRDQVGDAMMLVPPDKPRELGKVIRMLLEDSNLKRILSQGANYD